MLTYYDTIRQFRLTESKPALKKYKGTPDEIYWQQKDSFYKVVLNGISGHLDSVNSPLYYPEGIMKVRVGGQLILTWLAERCALYGWDVLSLNTDGITLKMKRDDLEKYYSVIEQCEQQYDIIFEHDFYKKVVYASVNSYIAIPEKGKIKQKGEFVTKPELGNSTDMMVVPKALNAYFIDSIRPEEFIYSKELHIYDFCLSQKCDKSYTVEWNGKKQQRLNRYYVSTKGAYLYKCRENKKHHMMKGFGVQIYNVHQEKPINQFSINYGYYLKQINDKISEIERHKQLNLFS